MLVIRRILCALLTPLLLASPALASSDPPPVSAAAAVVLHPSSGTVLFSLNEDEPMLIASTTKLMTALLAAERLDPDEEAEIRPGWTGAEGSSMYLRPGERYLVRELLEGLLLSSGNDAALALAGITAGEQESFVELMNEKCRELGLADTHFDNPHGLDSPTHRSSALDLAKLMSAVLSVPLLREIMGMKSCVIHGAVHDNHNQLLRTCPGVFAGKTGYTRAAGRCLVSACSRDGMELICVTLSDRNDWRDHAALYDWAYGAYRELSIPAGEELCRCPLVSGAQDSVGLTCGESVSLCLPAEKEIRLRCNVPPFILAPAAAGERAGTAELLAGDELLGRVPMTVGEEAAGASRGAFLPHDAVERFTGICAA